MVWADRIVAQIRERFTEKIAGRRPLIIRDEKTLSGPVHVGSLRGFVLHGLVDQVLRERGVASIYRYEFNDMDPMDALPPEHAEEFRTYMGKPLYAVPSPEPADRAKGGNYPEYYGMEFKSVLDKLQFDTRLSTLKPEYEAGKFNDCIVQALDAAEEVRTIYAEVSGGRKSADWLPVSVICENCGKVGTTKAIAWDRLRGVVRYRCEAEMVVWAQGCGHEGEIAPFDGRAKLPWKVEWAAKWKVFGVDIEGAGKDHSAAGGSRAIAARISEEVFSYPNPFDIPYEFFNIGGKKMSASKGLGATAHHIGNLLPPKILKLLMIRRQPNQPIDFDPEGTTIPELFDEYDRLASHYFGEHQNADPDFKRTFELTQVPPGTKPEDRWQLRFSTVAFLGQMPHLQTEAEAAKLKGSPLTESELTDLNQRRECALFWLLKYAPEKYKFELRVSPSASFVTHPLTEPQVEALQLLRDRLEALRTWEGSLIHELIHAVKGEKDIAPHDLFTPLYQLFLGRDDGPQLGWFLSTLSRKEVISRIGLLL